MHREEPHLARRPGLDREIRAPAHVVLGQAQGPKVAVAAELEASPDREADVLDVTAFREAEIPVGKDHPRGVLAVGLLECNDVRGQAGGEAADPPEVVLAPASFRDEIAGDGALVTPGPMVGLAAGGRERIEGGRQHHPLEIPGRERQALDGRQCGRE